MAKQVSRWLLCALTAVLLVCTAAGAVGVEQIQVSLPRVDLYVHATGENFRELTREQISATLDGSPLEVESFQPSEQGIFYIFMLDVSKSIPATHLEAAKEAVRNVAVSLRAQDKLALLTFGNEVSVLADGMGSAADTLAKLDALACTDNHTKFYDAMNTLVEMASRTADMRRVAVVVSDGVDDTDAGMSEAEMENVLLQKGIAVYALCVDTASSAGVERFRSFIQLSGGELYTFGADSAQTVLTQLIDKLNNVWLLQLLVTTEIRVPGAVPLYVKFGSAAELSTKLESSYWTPDTTPPYVTTIVSDAAAHSVTVSFSEPVSGADEASCYSLTDGSGVELTPASITYVGSDRRTVRLIVPDLRADVAYTFTADGPVDLSPDHNALVAYQTGISPAQTGEQQAEPAPMTEESLEAELRNLLLLTVGAVLAVVALILLIVHFNAQQSPPPKKATGKHGIKQPGSSAAKERKAVVKTRFLFENKKEK